MAATKYLLIGGGTAGHAAVEAIRKHDARGAITMVSAEKHLPYDRPPLTKEFLRGQKPQDKLYFATPESYKALNVQSILGVRVEALDPKAKSVKLSTGESMTFEKALLATGGTPNRLSVQGSTLPNVHYIRTIEDALGLQKDAREGARAVIIGAGFIGIEVASSLTQRGVKATVLESAAHIWPKFANREIASYFEAYCEKHGVTFIAGEQASQILGDRRATAVVTKSGQRLPCDVVVVAVGIRPNTELAQAAGLKIDNGVVVDERMRTSHPDVYAAGDIANYPDPLFGARRRVEHWGHAEHTGQVAGNSMAGGKEVYDLVTYVWSEVFDLHLEFAGDESQHDQMIVRGSFENNAFTAMYLLEGKLRAYFAVGADSKDFPILQRAIKEHRDVSRVVKRLEDPAANLRVVLRKKPGT